MALNQLGRLDVVFSFKDQSGPGISSAKRGINQFETAAVGAATRTRNAFMGAFPALLTLNLIRGATRAFMGFLKPAADFETSMRKVATFANLGGESFEEFEATGRKTFQTISLITGKTAPDIAQAFTEMSKKGVDARNALSSLNSVAKLAVLSEIEVAEAAEVASTLFRVWGFRGKELEQRMNQLTIAAANSAINFDELGGLLTRSASGIFQAKPAFEDFLFLLSKTRDISASAAITGTQLRRAYEKFGESFGTIAGQLDVSTEDMNGNLRDISNTLFEAVTKGTRSSAEIQQIIRKEVGSRAAIPFTAIVGRIDQLMERFGGNIAMVREEFFKLRGTTQGSGEAISDMFAKLIQKNPQLVLDRLNAAWQFMIQQIGPMLLPSLGRFIGQLTGLLIKVGQFFEKMQKTKEEVTLFGISLGTTADIIGSLFKTIGGGLVLLGTFRAIGTLFQSVFNFMTGGAVSATRAVSALTTAQAANTVAAKANAVANQQLALSFAQSGTAAAGAAAATTAGTAARGVSAAAGGVGLLGRAKGAAGGLLGKVTGAVGATRVGKGAASLFGKIAGSSIGKAVGPLLGKVVGRGFLRGGLGIAGRLIGGLAGGPIGLGITALSFGLPFLLDKFDLFGTSTKELEETLQETNGKLGETADAMRQAPDKMAGAFRAAQVEAEEVAKAPLPVLSETLLKKDLPKAIAEASQRIVPEQRAQFEKTASAQFGIVQKAFDEIVQAQLAGRPVDLKTRTALIDATGQLGTILRGVGDAADVKDVQDVAKQLFATSTGFAAVNEGLTRQGSFIGDVLAGRETTTTGQQAFLEKQAVRGQAALGAVTKPAQKLASFPEDGAGVEDPAARQSRMLTDSSRAIANNTALLLQKFSRPMPVELNTSDFSDAIAASFSSQGDRSLGTENP